MTENGIESRTAEKQTAEAPVVGSMRFAGPHHVLQWHITHKCNLRCSHCYQDDYTAEMTRDELFAVLDKYSRFLAERNLQGHINLTGGEPFASPYFFDLAEEITRRGITFAVLTNGTLADENIVMRLARLKPRFVQVSLDGGPDVHDAIRGKGACEKALRGIDMLKAYGIRVLISFTAQRTNRFELERVTRIAEQHRVDKVWWDRVIIPKAEDKDRLMLTPLQFRVLAKRSARLTAKTKRGDGPALLQSVRGLQFLYCPDTYTYNCSAGKNLLIILANGDLMPCRRLPHIIGNIRDGEIAPILEASPVMKQLREAGIPEACGGCPHAEQCRGGSRCVTCAKTGSFTGRDPDCRVRGRKTK